MQSRSAAPFPSHCPDCAFTEGLFLVWSGCGEGITISWENRARQSSLAGSWLSFFLPADIQRAYPSAEQKVTFVAWRGLGGGCEERRGDPSGASLPLESAAEKALTAMIFVSKNPRESCWESQVGANVLQGWKLWISLCLILWWC